MNNTDQSNSPIKETSEKIEAIYNETIAKVKTLEQEQKKVITDYIKKLEKYLQNLHKKVKFSWINSDVSDSKISKEIALADVVFISGGDTEYLIKRLSKKSINESLIEAYKKGVVIIGNSAGALALAEVGVSLNNCMFKKYQGIALIDKYIPVVHFCDDPNSGFNEFKRSHSNKEFVYLKENESCVIVNNQKLVKLN